MFGRIMKKPFEITKNCKFALHVGNDYDFAALCWLSVSIWRLTISVRLPQLFSLQMETIITRTGSCDQLVGKRYGFEADARGIQLFYGRQANSNVPLGRKMQRDRKRIVVPWKKSRKMHHDFLNIDGTLFVRVFNTTSGKDDTAALHAAEFSVPKAKINFKDANGQRIEVLCSLQEITWRQYTGIMKMCELTYTPVVERFISCEVSVNGATAKKRLQVSRNTSSLHSIEHIVTRRREELL